jgi:aminoglycoside phosphotransferase (APT) family kinase protein
LRTGHAANSVAERPPRPAVTTMAFDPDDASRDDLAGSLLAYLRRVLGSGVAYREPLRPLRGGFVTDVYAFALTGADDAWSRLLVLRVYPADVEAASVRRERCAQEVVAAQGLPAPRVLACEDVAGPLERPFLLMEHLPGRPQMVIELPGLLRELPRLPTLPRRHAAALDLVHRLEPAPLLRAFETASIDRRTAGLAYWFDGAEARIARWGFDALRPTLAWLRAHRPPDPGRLAICHGDLFGANILEQRGRITGILDWGGVTVADPAFDVGGQIAAYEMSAMPGPRALQVAALGHGRLLAAGLRRAYRRHRPIAEDRLRYYAALRAFTELVFKLGLQAEVRATGVPRRMPTWLPAQCARYVERRTGVAIARAAIEA